MMKKKFEEFTAPFPQREILSNKLFSDDAPFVVEVPKIDFEAFGRFWSYENSQPAFPRDAHFIRIAGFRRYAQSRGYVKKLLVKYYQGCTTRKERYERRQELFERVTMSCREVKHACPREMEAWENLENKVPRRFLEEIGVDPYIFNTLIEHDGAEYLRQLKRSFSIDRYIIRIMAGMYQPSWLPYPMTEKEAIMYMIGVQQRQALYKLCYNVLDLKSVFVLENQKVSVLYYYPQMTIRGDMLAFSTSNRDNAILQGEGKGGTIRIKNTGGDKE